MRVVEVRNREREGCYLMAEVRSPEQRGFLSNN